MLSDLVGPAVCVVTALLTVGALLVVTLATGFLTFGVVAGSVVFAACAWVALRFIP